jgi:hypothetical protein
LFWISKPNPSVDEAFVVVVHPKMIKISSRNRKKGAGGIAVVLPLKKCTEFPCVVYLRGLPSKVNLALTLTL